ncbi:MAG: cache and HAMP domain-containing protein [Bdellovibrionota bacterium]
MRSIRSVIFSQFFVLVLTFAAAVCLIAYVYLKNAVTQIVISNNEKALDYIVDNIGEAYRVQLSHLEKLARLHGISPYDRKTAVKIIRDFLALETVYGTIHFYGRNGDLLIAEQREGFPVYHSDKNFNQRPDSNFRLMAQRVFAGGKPEFSSTLFTRINTHYYTFVVPVFSAHGSKPAVTGVLSGGIFPSVHSFDKFLNGLILSTNNFIVISDADGHVISSNNISNREINPQLRAFFVTKESSSGKWTSTVRGDYFLIKKQVGQVPMSVVTLGVSASVVNMMYWGFMKYIFVVLSLGLVAGLIASILIANRLAKPFRLMAEGVHQLSIGNFAHRIEYKSKNEVGLVIRLLNALAERLQKGRYLGNLWGDESEIRRLLAKEKSRLSEGPEKERVE